MSPVTNTDQQFKKAEQEITPNVATNHNIHDDYINNPPNNLSSNAPSQPSKARGLKEGAQDTWARDVEPGVLGHEDVGRQKRTDVESDITQEHSVHGSS
ncbi:hypothetical protein PLICRDRAFT_697078 [Plicaturopsis crispa FD-325 SS-3]|nr:hypothetical protein PLICRDRAFT_697078 [Plicaturopsis crispa FD-325 SS-3]